MSERQDLRTLTCPSRPGDDAPARSRQDRLCPAASPTAPCAGYNTAIVALGSLAADAALVMIGTRLFPSTAGYVHFRFSDYGS